MFWGTSQAIYSSKVLTTHQKQNSNSSAGFTNLGQNTAFTIYMDMLSRCCPSAEMNQFPPFRHQVQLEEDQHFCPNKSLTWIPHTTDDWGSKCNQHFLIITMREMELKPWSYSDFLLPWQKGLSHLIGFADSCIWTLSEHAVVRKKSSLMSNYKESQEKEQKS